MDALPDIRRAVLMVRPGCPPCEVRYAISSYRMAVMRGKIAGGHEVIAYASGLPTDPVFELECAHCNARYTAWRKDGPAGRLYLDYQDEMQLPCSGDRAVLPGGKGKA